MRMFELMDRLPSINMEGGLTLPSVNESKFQLLYMIVCQALT